MCRKIRCDRESRTFYKIFGEVNKALVLKKFEIIFRFFVKFWELTRALFKNFAKTRARPRPKPGSGTAETAAAAAPWARGRELACESQWSSGREGSWKDGNGCAAWHRATRSTHGNTIVYSCIFNFC